MKLETDVAAEIDQQTKDDVQPPCDSRRPDDTPCAHPAKWIVWFRCPAHARRGPAFECGYHLQVAVNGRMRCLFCVPARVYLTATRIEAL